MVWNLRLALAALAAFVAGCSNVSPIPPGSSPLANAVVNKRPDAVQQLLASGESPDSVDERGTTALVLAAATDQFVIANMLVDQNANIWAASKLGYTAAIYANTSHIPDDSEEGQARLRLIERLKAAGYPWPPPWPDDVMELRSAGQWPPLKSDQGTRPYSTL